MSGRAEDVKLIEKCILDAKRMNKKLIWYKTEAVMPDENEEVWMKEVLENKKRIVNNLVDVIMKGD